MSPIALIYIESDIPEGMTIDRYRRLQATPRTHAAGSLERIRRARSRRRRERRALARSLFAT
jgi:hypothetical protein